MAKEKKKSALSYRRGTFGKVASLPVTLALKEIQRVEAKFGRITPHDLLKENSTIGSPLHSFFEWDDDAAAESYRLHQARALIRSIVIEKQIEGSTEPTLITVFHSASDKDGKAYFSLDRIASDVDLFLSAAEMMGGQVMSLQRSLASLNSIAPKHKKENVKKLKGAVDKVEHLTGKLSR